MNLVSLTIVCVITIVTTIGFSVLPELFTHIKAENNGISGNLILLVKEGVAHGRVGNYTGAMDFFDKALAILQLFL
jgi:hypothetical protein